MLPSLFPSARAHVSPAQRDAPLLTSGYHPGGSRGVFVQGFGAPTKMPTGLDGRGACVLAVGFLAVPFPGVLLTEAVPYRIRAAWQLLAGAGVPGCQLIYLVLGSPTHSWVSLSSPGNAKLPLSPYHVVLAGMSCTSPCAEATVWGCGAALCDTGGGETGGGGTAGVSA